MIDLEFLRDGDGCLEIVITGNISQLEMLSKDRFMLVRKIPDKTATAFFVKLTAYLVGKLDHFGLYERGQNETQTRR